MMTLPYLNFSDSEHPKQFSGVQLYKRPTQGSKIVPAMHQTTLSAILWKSRRAQKNVHMRHLEVLIIGAATPKFKRQG
eukprot:5875031-Amphidinium_carterae.1